jgi:hypothetical protein
MAERRRRWPHRNTVRRPVGRRLVLGRRCPDACRGLVTLSASSVSVHTSGVRCERPVSARAMSTRPVSNVRVWTSGVPRRWPRVPRSRPRCPHRVTSWSASVRRAATRPGGPGSGRPAVSANGSGSCPSQSRGAAPAQAVLGQQGHRAGPRRRRGRRSGSGARSTAWPARDTPVARQDRPSVEEQRPRAVHPICGMAAHRSSGPCLPASGRP